MLDKATISDSRKIVSFLVFSTEIEGKRLHFKNEKNSLVDEKTGTIWSLTGKGLEGFHKGTPLKPLIHGQASSAERCHYTHQPAVIFLYLKRLGWSAEVPRRR